MFTGLGGGFNRKSNSVLLQETGGYEFINGGGYFAGVGAIRKMVRQNRNKQSDYEKFYSLFS